MLKLAGFRVTPFFLFILALECLACLISVYLGLLLYKGSALSVSVDLMEHAVNTGLFLVVLIAILTPGFLFQTKIINNIKKSVSDLMPGLAVAVVVMAFVVLTNHTGLNAKMYFLAAVLSACIGLTVNQLGLLRKYWRFLVRVGVN